MNIFKTWESIRQIINITTKGNKKINCIQNDNKTTRNSTEIASNSSNHFTLITEKLQHNLVKLKINFPKYLSKPNEQSFFIIPTNGDEVPCEISKLKKTIRSSSIPFKIIKFCKATLSEPIFQIANIYFLTGTLPSTLKTANVIPIYKKESYTLCNNYCSIFLVSNVGTIIGKLVQI